MAENIALDAKTREVFGKKNKGLRKQGMIPAVLYGTGTENLSLEVPAIEFSKVYKQAGENTLIDLSIDGKNKKKVLIQEVAKHFMKDEPVHVDFYAVDLTRKINAAIPLHFLGTSSAVKESGGTLIRNITEIEISALPTNLPQYFEVDISPLKTFEDLIRVEDLKVPEDVEFLTNPEEVIAKVEAPRTTEELEALEETVPSDEEKEAIEAVAGEEGEDTEEDGESEEKEDGGKSDDEESDEEK